MMPDRFHRFLDDIAHIHLDGVTPLVSVVVFGSAASGAVSQSSDVDLILVIPNDTTPEDVHRLQAVVTNLEIKHGFRLPTINSKNPFQRFADRAAGHAHACFCCTRGDLVSGDVARIFGLRPAEAVFLERTFFASVIVSARTVWGEDLVSLVPLPSLQRLDVFKSLFRFTGLVLMSASAFPLLPDATRYAMNALKYSLHSCYFCYHLKTAPLAEEVEFFNSRLGRKNTLSEMLQLRREYHPSFSFVLRCVPILLRLHLRTARDNRFPRAITQPTISN